MHTEMIENQWMVGPQYGPFLEGDEKPYQCPQTHEDLYLFKRIIISLINLFIHTVASVTVVSLQ
jgi:hypothetical protein